MASHQCHPGRRHPGCLPVGRTKPPLRKLCLSELQAVLPWVITAQKGKVPSELTGSARGSSLLPETGGHSSCFVETQDCLDLCWETPQPVPAHASLQAIRVMALLGKRKSSPCLEQTQHFSIPFLKPRWIWGTRATSMPSTVTFEKCFYTWADSLRKEKVLV